MCEIKIEHFLHQRTLHTFKHKMNSHQISLRKKAYDQSLFNKLAFLAFLLKFLQLINS